jgi:hypothetical protein
MAGPAAKNLLREHKLRRAHNLFVAASDVHPAWALMKPLPAALVR